MKKIKPNYRIESSFDRDYILKQLESAGRTAYKSEDKITNESASRFIKMIVDRGHTSVLEHQSVTVRIICDRGISHEIVRHRLASYTQESTRYCNYSKDKFNNEITFIEPCFFTSGNMGADVLRKRLEVWEDAMRHAEMSYFKLLELGATPEEARSVLPNSLKTEAVITMNLREWYHFFEVRTASDAHPQMLEITIPLLAEFKKKLPEIFGRIDK